MRINKAEIEAANWINKNLEYYNNTIRYRDVITYSNPQFFYVLTDKRVFGSTKILCRNWNNISEICRI